MNRTEERRPGWGTEAATEVRAGSRTEASIPRPADIAVYRHRRACRLAESHLRAHGLWGPLSARVLADLAGEVTA